MDSKTIVAMLSALAQEHRLSAFRFLVQRGPEGAAAGSIAEHLGVPPSSMSFHLNQLEHCGLILHVRRGRSLIYSANFAAMNGLVGYLMENCCGGEACAPMIERPSI